ncbi:hypothetical protein ANO14919_046140 [Xylariales sp. No.14919]|nr:hypothetical protein ANO14919_046140 [Xylariales sp. No.14919]
MCELFVVFYNCSNPEKCVESTKVKKCDIVKAGGECGHDKPGTYERVVEDYAEGLCRNGHKERGR